MQIWAGTGEEDSRNSISPGGGIYKSTDGGLTWTLMGLEQTQAIGRIVVHPTNPDIVYVAAVGAPWNANAERGLYRTTDGGRTWTLSKFVSDSAGFIDVAMHPRNPDVLFAASWQRIRGPYFLRSGGPGSALWKSVDAGRTWTEVKGGGWPETELGRIGIDISRSNPDVMYAMVEAANAPDGKRLSGLYRSADGGATWAHMNTNNVRPFYYSQVRVDPERPDRVYWSSTPVNFSDDGGRTVRTTTIGLHVDHHAMWIDPADANRIVVGNDGGIGISFDRGGNWDFPNTLPLGQFYEVSYDMAVPYNVCGGLQDNGSWCGPSRRARGGITNSMWASVNGGDGFFTAQDPRDPGTVYAESQGGNMMRVDMRTGETVRLQKPNWRDRYRQWEDSIVVERGDTAQPVPDTARLRLEAFRQRQLADSMDLDLRWNWNTPFLLSPHDPDVFYAGASRVLKSTKRGEDLAPISPDLTRADTMKIRVSTRATGGVTPDITGAETFGTIVALAESPLRRGMLFVGTDDGLVWLSPDDGATWNPLTDRFRGLVPEGTYVRRIEPSRHDPARFYIAFDGHRTGDYTPYVLVTDDGGRRFRSIAAGLPAGGPDFVHVIREDPVNPDLLYVGTDVGVYVSLDRGARWQKFHNKLPTVPVHDLQVHPRDRELIAATHGRSLWIVNVAPLQELRGELLTATEPRFFDPLPAAVWGSTPMDGQATGQRWFSGESQAFGAQFVYYNPKDVEGRTTLVITTAQGDTVQTLYGSGRPGLHDITWNLRTRRPARGPLSPSEVRDSIRNEARVRFVSDSLIAAGLDSSAVRQAAERLSGDISSMRIAGGAGRGRFVERPGESPPPAEARTGENPEEVQRAQRAFREAGLRGTGGFGAPQPPLAEPGEYTVTLLIGERALTQTLRVEAPPGAP
jgi:hypothetical protein